MSQIQEQGFSLVSGLAAELSGGELELPSLPEVVVRIKTVLSQPDFSVDELARCVAMEPTLVASILTMANSVMYRRSSDEVTDLKIAIARVGAGMIQSAATSFALRKLRESDDFSEVADLLSPEWARMAQTAAATYLVAKLSRKIKPDEALVVGLLHNIGRIYLYSRSPKYPEIFESEAQVAELMDSWHANVAKAILESWELPGETVEAVAQQDEVSTDPACPLIFAGLTAGIAAAALSSEPTPEETGALLERSDFQRLGLGEEQIAEIAATRDQVRQELGLGTS